MGGIWYHFRMTIVHPSPTLDAILQQSAARHGHLCPRQVLGARMALAGAATLGIDLPARGKRLLVIAETDGCFLSGLEVAAGVSAHHRTLRIEDYGKIAATFIEIETGKAVRVAPHNNVRSRAWEYAPPGETRRYFVMLYAYQIMPTDALLTITPVQLAYPIDTIVSRASKRTTCEQCGEEIHNGREVRIAERVLCRACAGDTYYVEGGTP